MRSGAFDYVTKPFRLDELGIIIQKALEVAKLKKENIGSRESSENVTNSTVL